LVRVNEQIDATTAVKFAFLHFTGPNAKRMLTAKQSIHAGSIKEFFAPYHVSISADRKAEVSAAIVDEEVAKASGRKSHVLGTTVPSEVVTASKPKAHADDKPAPAASTDGANRDEAKKTTPTKPSAPKASGGAAAAASSGARAPLGV
jgi:hypothetical protein